MPDSLTVPQVGIAPHTAAPVAAPQHVTASAGSRSPAGPNFPNPTMRLDAALGIVVLELRGDTGAVIGSIPTERELRAYRTGLAADPTSGAAAAPPVVLPHASAPPPVEGTPVAPVQAGSGQPATEPSGYVSVPHEAGRPAAAGPAPDIIA